MIVLAMSGGIDSAAAGWLLQQRGETVRGLFLKHRYQYEDEAGARTVAEHLDIPLDILDVSDAFEKIVDTFTESYFSGRTPNPCVLCNRTIKFGILFDHAIQHLAADGFATGHYVRRGEVNGYPALYRGIDRTKDQSYVLYGIGREKLAKLHFPLGDRTKADIRLLAEKIGLPNRENRESQDLCFVENGRHFEFLRERCPDCDTSGNFVTPDGRFLALHDGFERFTIGQRKGFGVGFGKRVFVLRLDADRKEVVLGDWDELASFQLRATDGRWLTIEDPMEPFCCHVKIRYACRPVRARVEPGIDGTFSVEFEEAQHGIAPGQSVVCYDSDRLLGGGIIVE